LDIRRPIRTQSFSDDRELFINTPVFNKNTFPKLGLEFLPRNPSVPVCDQMRQDRRRLARNLHALTAEQQNVIGPVKRKAAELKKNVPIALYRWA
jgi:hypothetical protein